ncbi:hypothetical protein [Rubidibacter lacunae]|nr:hypothetical protein [Rubidibacter lacunae]
MTYLDLSGGGMKYDGRKVSMHVSGSEILISKNAGDPIAIVRQTTEQAK